jgi:hypothetical protein
MVVPGAIMQNRLCKDVRDARMKQADAANLSFPKEMGVARLREALGEGGLI